MRLGLLWQTWGLVSLAFLLVQAADSNRSQWRVVRLVSMSTENHWKRQKRRVRLTADLFPLVLN